ncbi:hypothetical protein II906_13635 [bacterium]|nr:hypothetical protein [bacterium]
MQQEEKQKKNKDLIKSLVVFIILLILIFFFMIWLKKLMPNFLMKQGKKYLEIEAYDKALRMFNLAGKSKPYEIEPVYYQVITLSKMPITYENQVKLIGISKNEAMDKPSKMARNVLIEMRSQLLKTAGENYIDNILYKGKLIRFNNSEPITYSIMKDETVPDEYLSPIQDAFSEWQKATNAQLKFKNTYGNENAKIIIKFIDDEKAKSALSAPDYGTKLKRVNITIRLNDTNGKPYSDEKLKAIALHQIGHAVGLWGHSSNVKDVMSSDEDYSSKANLKRTITKRDINTLLLLYKMLPDYIDKPLTFDETQTMFFHQFITMYPDKNYEEKLNTILKDANKEQLDKFYNIALKYQAQKQYEMSNFMLVKLSQNIKEDFPHKADLYYNIALNYYKLSLYKNAQESIKKAISIKDDKKSEVLNAFIALRMKQLDFAQEKLEEYFRQDNTNIDIAINLAITYHFKKNKKKEREVLKILIRNNKKAAKDLRVLSYKKL